MFSEKSTILSLPLPKVLVRWKCQLCRRLGFVQAPAGFETLQALVEAHGDTCENQRIALFDKPVNWCEFVPEDGGEDEFERARRQRTRPPLTLLKPEPSWTRN